MKIKVAQCWDDGVVNDIRVIELLRKYNAKATFNLNPGLMREERIPSRWLREGEHCWAHKGFISGKIGRGEMREIYEDFQVASHCWKHENAGSIPDKDFLKAAMDARNFLEDIFQRPCRGFAWPCGMATPETASLLHEAGFAYGRLTGATDDITKCPNPMLLTPNCHFQDTAFWNRFEAAKKTGRFYFWGHSYEMLQDDNLWEQYELKLRELTNNPDTEWVDVIDLVQDER